MSFLPKASQTKGHVTSGAPCPHTAFRGGLFSGAASLGVCNPFCTISGRGASFFCAKAPKSPAQSQCVLGRMHHLNVAIHRRARQEPQVWMQGCQHDGCRVIRSRADVNYQLVYGFGPFRLKSTVSMTARALLGRKGRPSRRSAAFAETKRGCWPPSSTAASRRPPADVHRMVEACCFLRGLWRIL